MIWIGEESDIGLGIGIGIGTQMMRQALDLCFDEPDATAVIIDPLARSAAARGLYERLSFRSVGPRRFGTDGCMVDRLERPRPTA